MDTVDKVLGDVEALHSKLDRKNKVEETNWSTSQQLQIVSVLGSRGRRVGGATHLMYLSLSTS